MSPANWKRRLKEDFEEIEMLAQLDAVLLAAAIELWSHEVVMPRTHQDGSQSIPTPLVVVAPKSALVPRLEELGAEEGEAANRPAVTFHVESEQDKPLIRPDLLELAVACVRQVNTFPEGIRERITAILSDEYSLGKHAQRRLLLAAKGHCSDGNILPETAIQNVIFREKARLRSYAAVHYSDTQHLLAPSIPQLLSAGI
jgi:hypothetical protein